MNVAEAVRHSISELEQAKACIANARQLLGLSGFTTSLLDKAEIEVRTQLLELEARNG